MNEELITRIGVVASVTMPLFNIPLIVKIIKRRSSNDISIGWLLGIWICSLLIAPSGLNSPDMAWKAFTVVNLILFTGVVAVVFKYRSKN